ncbi:MAG: hypothetical protein IJS14_10800 [Lentisphaeria bacterium]|nr:hypothetical protein [Lentisphaeria bacterium]
MTKFIMTAAAALVSAAAFGQVLWERKIDPPKDQKEYYFSQGPIDLIKIAPPGQVKVTIVASGDAKVGCRLRVFPQKGKPEFKTIFWNRQLKGDSAEYSGVTDFVIDQMQFRRVEIYTYNIQKKGTFKVEALKVSVPGKKETPEVIPVAEAKTYTEFAFKPGFFPVGVYVYFYGKKGAERYAAQRNMTVEQYVDTIFADMKEHGCNVVYVANLTTDPPFFKFVCETADKHGLKVFAQGTGELYVRTNKDFKYFETVTVPAIKKYLPQYNDIPNLVGYTSKEEVSPTEKEMKLMKEGRRLSNEMMPKIPVFTLHNNINSMRKDTGADIPEWFGFDRYRFRMVENAKRNYVISTPSDMTRLISKEIGEFYDAAAALKRPLIYVGQGYKAHEIRKSAKYSKATGYKEIEPGVWKGYFRYMPKNGMHLQFWIAVSRGCRGYLIYHYQTSSEGNEVGRLYEEDLVDLRGKESWYWKEAGECFKANARLLPVFSEWCREGKPAASSPTKDVHVNTFILPGFKGRFILPLNTQIATWDKTNPFRTDENTQLHSNDENLQGFEWSGPRKIELKLANQGELRDLLTGGIADPAEITLPPGQGRVYFQGSQAEFEAVKKHFNL